MPNLLNAGFYEAIKSSLYTPRSAYKQSRVAGCRTLFRTTCPGQPQAQAYYIIYNPVGCIGMNREINYNTNHPCTRPRRYRTIRTERIIVIFALSFSKRNAKHSLLLVLLIFIHCDPLFSWNCQVLTIWVFQQYSLNSFLNISIMKISFYPICNLY